jgi:ATP-dependent RNA helicase DeaD
VNETEPGPRFVDLGLPESVLQVLTNVGYESPSPIQAATIPPLLAGRDVIGQAQTGTGKTAAFALPTLSRIDPTLMKVQALVLAPTRELAIQVSEAFQRYAAGTPQFHVLPIYGGSSYGKQLTALKRGVHVVVGTPGRVVDHLTRGTLDLSALKFLVLDEADEMLRMGFIDDVEAVITKCPDERQVALFSATMPPPIRRIDHCGQHPPAVRPGEPRTQARRPDAHHRSRAVRRNDHLRAHQDRHRRAGGEARGTRNRSHGDQRRPGSGAA